MLLCDVSHAGRESFSAGNAVFEVENLEEVHVSISEWNSLEIFQQNEYCSK